MLEILSLDEHVAADNILGLGIGAVGDVLLLPLDHLTGLLQRTPGVHEVAFLAELLEPRNPFLQVFLVLLGGPRSISSTAKQKCKFTHGVSSFGFLTLTLGQFGANCPLSQQLHACRDQNQADSHIHQKWGYIEKTKG